MEAAVPDFCERAKENKDQTGLHFQLIHHAIPETGRAFHYFFSVTNGYRQDEPKANELLNIFHFVFRIFIDIYFHLRAYCY